MGLILASASSGPIARFLIRRHRLGTPFDDSPRGSLPSPAEEQELWPTPGSGEMEGTTIDSLDFLGAVLAIHVCIIFGSILQEVIQDLGLFLPLLSAFFIDLVNAVMIPFFLSRA